MAVGSRSKMPKLPTTLESPGTSKAFKKSTMKNDMKKWNQRGVPYQLPCLKRHRFPDGFDDTRYRICRLRPAAFTLAFAVLGLAVGLGLLTTGVAGTFMSAFDFIWGVFGLTKVLCAASAAMFLLHPSEITCAVYAVLTCTVMFFALGVFTFLTFLIKKYADTTRPVSLALKDKGIYLLIVSIRTEPHTRIICAYLPVIGLVLVSLVEAAMCFQVYRYYKAMKAARYTDSRGKPQDPAPHDPVLIVPSTPGPCPSSSTSVGASRGSKTCSSGDAVTATTPSTSSGDRIGGTRRGTPLSASLKRKAKTSLQGKGC